MVGLRVARLAVEAPAMTSRPTFGQSGLWGSLVGVRRQAGQPAAELQGAFASIGHRRSGQLLGPQLALHPSQKGGSTLRSPRRGRGVPRALFNGDGARKATPYEVLGVAVGASEGEIKAAFRAKIKMSHPDVYKGEGDSETITKQLVEAYEALLSAVQRKGGAARGWDTAEEDPWEDELRPWVNELQCQGRGCRYSCVTRAPNTFCYALETGRARLKSPDMVRGRDADYTVQLAVGQCPELCIHYVTQDQADTLTGILQGIIEGSVAVETAGPELFGLISRFEFENNRQPGPKRKPSKSTDFVDWYDVYES